VDQEQQITEVSHFRVKRTTAGVYDEVRAMTKRIIYAAYDNGHYAVDRIIGGELTESYFKTQRRLFATRFFDATDYKVTRKIGHEDDAWFTTTRIEGIVERSHCRIRLVPTIDGSLYVKTKRLVGQENDCSLPLTRQLGNVDQGFSIVHRMIAVEEEQVSPAIQRYHELERSVWTAERRIYLPAERSLHTTERQIVRNNDFYGTVISHISNKDESHFASKRLLWGRKDFHFPVNRNIIVAHERSEHIIHMRFIEIESGRTKVLRHISTGRDTSHYTVGLSPTTPDTTTYEVSRRVCRTEDTPWLFIREMGKEPEEYFGKACIFRANVSNLTFSPESVDTNEALDYLYSDKEALLEIATKRDDTHDAVNLHGNIVEFHDGQLIYYPPLNGQSTVLIVPNWNTSEEMTQECRKKNMIVEAYRQVGKHYKLHVRFDEPPTVPLFFSIVVMNPDRTLNDGKNPTIINMITAKDFTPEQLAKLSTIVNKQENE